MLSDICYDKSVFVLAMKIHISSETQKALQEFDIFILEERGKVEMKVEL